MLGNLTSPSSREFGFVGNWPSSLQSRSRLPEGGGGGRNHPVTTTKVRHGVLDTRFSTMKVEVARTLHVPYVEEDYFTTAWYLDIVAFGLCLQCYKSWMRNMTVVFLPIRTSLNVVFENSSWGISRCLQFRLPLSNSERTPH